MKRRGWLLAGVLVMGILAAACSENNPAPEGDPPVLGGFDVMPKQIVTIALTPTPSPVMAGGQAVVVAQPTFTPAPPRPTATLTPYIGIFLGAPTSESGEPAPTLAPFVVNSGGGGAVVASGAVNPAGGGTCSFPAAATFANAYNANTTVQQRLGCPVNGGMPVAGMAAQTFERGVMFWRGDTWQIYALANNGQFWQVPDSWNDSIPADDPAYSPPSGLIQPVRGFGLVWRSNQPIRDALGWGIQPETQYDGFWQDFERGAMVLGHNSQVYAIYTAEGQQSGPLSP